METPAPEAVRGLGCTALRQQQQQQRTVSDNEETASLLHFISVASCNIKMALDRPSRNKRKVNHRKYLQKQLKTCGEASRKGSTASPVVTTTTTTTISGRNSGTMGLPYSSAFSLSDSPGSGPTLPHGHAARPHRRETSQVGLQVKSLNALFDPKTLMELRNLAEGEGRLGDPRDSCCQQTVRTGGGGGAGGAGGTNKVSLRSRNLPASFFVEPALRSYSQTGSAEAGARDGEQGGHRDAALTPCSLLAMDRAGAGAGTCAGPDRLQSPQFLLQQQPQRASYNLNCDGGATNSCGNHVGEAGTGLGGPCYPPVLMSDALESILGQQELSDLLCGGQWHQRDGASLPPCDTASAGPCSPRSLSDSSSSEAFCPQPSPSPGALSSASSSSSTPSSCASSACSPSWSPGFYLPPSHHAGPFRPHGWTGTNGEDPLSSPNLFLHQRFFAAMDSCSTSDIRLPQQALSKQLLQQHQRHQLIQLSGVQRNVPDHYPHYPHLQQQIQQQQQQQHQRLYVEGQYSMLSQDLQQTVPILDEQIPVLCSSPPASVLAPDGSSRDLSVPAFSAPFGCEPSPPQCAQPPSLVQHPYAPSHSVASHPLPGVSQLSPHQPQQHKFLELPTFPQAFSPCEDSLQAFKQQQLLPYEGAVVECASPLGWNYGGSEDSFGTSSNSQPAFFAYDVC